MSHYVVAVITRCEPDEETLREILAPYDENLSVPRYVKRTKAQIIADARAYNERYYNGRYAEYLKDPKKYSEENPNESHIQFIRDEFPKIYRMNDEELYQNEIKNTPKLSELEDGDESTAIDEDGNETSCYNPNSKWDWWEVGGRWYGEVPLRDGGETNSAQLRDIDFGNDVSIAAYLEKNPDVKTRYESLMNDGDGWYRLEYIQKRYPTLEDYVNHQKNWHTYALVDENGEWHEPGAMGWFGCSDTTPEGEIEWEKTFYDKFIKGKDNYWLTIVDCHI